MSASLALATIVAGPVPFAEHQAACAGKDGWSDPAPPVHIFGNVYDVGTCGIVALLIAGPKGHILIDAATSEAAPGIASNIRQLGFRLQDVKIILSTHEHIDHAGGFATMQSVTGATLRLSPPATAVVRTGTVDLTDPQFGAIEGPAPAKPGKPLRDGEVIRVGPLALTAHFTPAHVAGSTSWTWRSCEGKRCLAVGYVDSLTTISADQYRFVDHPLHVAEVRRGFAAASRLSCDLLITPHPGASDLYARLDGRAPMVDAGACKAYSAKALAAFKQRLAKEHSK